MFLPHVIEKTGRSTKPMDIISRLLQDRIIYIGDLIDKELSNSVIMQMLWLNADDPEKPINLYINSLGGVIYDGLAIKDIMYNLDCKVNTVGIGVCASMGAYLLASGTGTRKCTENCRIMIHSVQGGMEGHFQLIQDTYEETQHLQNTMRDHLLEFCKGKTGIAEMSEIMKRDKYIGYKKAIEIGLVDGVV